jgi:hypothetical protein
MELIVTMYLNTHEGAPRVYIGDRRGRIWVRKPWTSKALTRALRVTVVLVEYSTSQRSRFTIDLVFKLEPDNFAPFVRVCD